MNALVCKSDVMFINKQSPFIDVNLNFISWYPLAPLQHHLQPTAYFLHLKDTMKSIMTIKHSRKLPDVKWS